MAPIGKTDQWRANDGSRGIAAQSGRGEMNLPYETDVKRRLKLVVPKHDHEHDEARGHGCAKTVHGVSGNGVSGNGVSGNGRRGLTLIEILVSITLTLIIMGTVISIMGLIVGGVEDNRAMMEMVDRQRNVIVRLQADLQGHTASTLPWARVEAASGYIEYVEGIGNDRQPQPIPDDILMRDLADPQYRVLGDIDDVLMLTVRSRGMPFTGRGPNGTIIESSVAEVVWFVKPASTSAASQGTGDISRPLTLYRRVLLVRPDLVGRVVAAGRKAFFDQFDISARNERGRWIPNSLADLTKPENRYGHWRGLAGGTSSGTVGGEGASQSGRLTPINLSLLVPFDEQSQRLGEDVILNNCVGFDIKAFDPQAPIKGDENDAVEPGDIQYSGENLGFGTYVDLGQGEQSGVSQGEFSRRPNPLSKLHTVAGVSGVYDPWSFHFEHDGLAHGGQADQGTDGLDTQGGEVDIVDDARERQTAPPYAVPLRGLQVTIRVYEPRSRQVREVSVVGEFMPL